MLVEWVIGFLIVYNIVGFPEGILETAKGVLESGI
jgi:sodium-dependent dicarboxylate transporter 2/3/5